MLGTCGERRVCTKYSWVRFEIGYPSAGGTAIAFSEEGPVFGLRTVHITSSNDCEQVSRLLSVVRGSGLPGVFGGSMGSGAGG